MPFEAVHRPDHGLVITVPYGRIENEELPAYYAQRFEDGTLEPGLKELVDGRWIQEFAVDADGQNELVELLQDHRDELDGVRWAFIADSMLSFGMFRMFEAQKVDLPFTTGVFRTPGKAAEWLTVPVSELMIDPPVGL